MAYVSATLGKKKTAIQKKKKKDSGKKKKKKTGQFVMQTKLTAHLCTRGSPNKGSWSTSLILEATT